MKRRALQRAAEDDLQQRGGLAFRLLQCDSCGSVWPTERDEAHGGARLDGEPCAYRWAGGRVCAGRVYPFGHQPREREGEPRRPGVRAAYSGRWCDVLGLARGTTDLRAVRQAYRSLAKERHPDAGGTHEAMSELNDAYRLALSELAQP